MRDESRIDDVLSIIGTYWHKHPDLRLGQMIHVVATSGGYPDDFYVEDERLVELMRDFFDDKK